MEKTEKNVYSILADIQAKMKVPKDKVNTFGNFKYRNCEDILDEAKKHLDGAVLILGDKVLLVGTHYYLEANVSLVYNNETITTYAYAREAETHGKMSEGQMTGTASSYARKYALCGLFILDDGVDLDHDSQTKVQKTSSYAKPYAKKPTAATTATINEANAFLSDAEIPVIDSDTSMLGRAKGIIQATKNREATGAEIKQLEALDSKQLKIWVEDQEKKLLNA